MRGNVCSGWILFFGVVGGGKWGWKRSERDRYKRKGDVGEMVGEKVGGLGWLFGRSGLDSGIGWKAGEGKGGPGTGCVISTHNLR